MMRIVTHKDVFQNDLTMPWRWGGIINIYWQKVGHGQEWTRQVFPWITTRWVVYSVQVHQCTTSIVYCQCSALIHQCAFITTRCALCTSPAYYYYCSLVTRWSEWASFSVCHFLPWSMQFLQPRSKLIHVTGSYKYIYEPLRCSRRLTLRSTLNQF